MVFFFLILSFYLQYFNSTVELLESLPFLFFSAFQKWHSWLGEIFFFSREKIWRYRSRQDALCNLFVFQVLCKVLRNARGVTVAGVMKNPDSRKMCHLQRAFLKRKPNRLPRMRKSLGDCIMSRFFASRLQSVPTNFVWRNHTWWYSAGKKPYAAII